IQAHPSKWKLERIPGTALLNLDEHEVQSSEQIKDIITTWQGLPHTNKIDDQKVVARLAFQYQYDEAAKTRTKQSVTEIKRRHETIDEYSDHRFIKPFRAPLVKQPTFMQTKTALSAAEIGTAMHTVMQFIPLTKQWNYQEIENWIAQFVIEEKLTNEEANVI